jgi:hypothetical protein
VGKEDGVGVPVRLKPQVEALVKEVARITGYMPFTVRNVAVLYGLYTLASTRGLPKSDWEFTLLLENTQRSINRLKWGLRGGKGGKKR